jgi:hypothetical protein
MAWFRSGRTNDLQIHLLGDVATIALPSAFLPDDAFNSTYLPPDRIGNQELHKLRTNWSEFHFNFKSDPHSTLGGVDYRLWLNVALFENRDALDADVMARNRGGVPRPDEDARDGVRIVMQPDDRNYSGMLLIDEARLTRLHFRWRSDRYTPEKARKLLGDVAAGMVINEDRRSAYFRTTHQFLTARAATEEQNLTVLNVYLRSRNMPTVAEGLAAAKDGISYLVFRDSSQDEVGIVYFEAAKFVGEVTIAEFYGVDRHILDEDALLRAGFQADYRIVEGMKSVPTDAAGVFMNGLAKHSTAKLPSSRYFYATVSSNMTLQSLDPQRLFDRLNAAQLPSPLPRF